LSIASFDATSMTAYDADFVAPPAIDPLFRQLDPAPRLLMGPGPVDVYPRVLRAMSVPIQGQFDPEFTAVMNQVMALYRGVYRTRNEQTFMVDGTARAGIEACLASIVAPGEKVLVPIFGRFGHLKVEIASRLGAEVVADEIEWGTVFEADHIEDLVRKHRPKVVAICQGDNDHAAAAGGHRRDLPAPRYAAYVGAPHPLPATRSDVPGRSISSSGLQKCLSGRPAYRRSFNGRVLESPNIASTSSRASRRQA
jgi:(S)-ureidoglycine-glyoxylate aminotransferase